MTCIVPQIIRKYPKGHFRSLRLCKSLGLNHATYYVVTSPKHDLVFGLDDVSALLCFLLFFLSHTLYSFILSFSGSEVLVRMQYQQQITDAYKSSEKGSFVVAVFFNCLWLIFPLLILCEETLGLNQPQPEGGASYQFGKGDSIKSEYGPESSCLWIAGGQTGSLIPPWAHCKSSIMSTIELWLRWNS